MPPPVTSVRCSPRTIAFGRLSAEAAQLLRLCAFFSADPIPERFFREQSDSLAEPLANAARDTLTWEKTVGQLRRFGLVDRIAIPALDRPPDSTEVRTEQALTLHRLTQEVTRHTLCEVPKDCLAVQSVLTLACPADARLAAHWGRVTPACCPMCATWNATGRRAGWTTVASRGC